MKWPSGFRAAGIPCGIKSDGAADLGLLACDRPVPWAGTFTKNAAAASCVLWSRSRLGEPVRGIVVNSGNANACTGGAGEQAVHRTTRAAARVLACEEGDILVASTGPIGVPLPVDKIEGSLGKALDGASDDATPFARAILTSDTVTKTALGSVDDASLLGVAKGSAMLAPNMATMLAFIATDARTEDLDLQSCLEAAVRTSFDRISVDACESTNDSVFLLASGESKPVSAEVFKQELSRVCADLAYQMVKDAEGGSKVVRVGVEGARDDQRAVALGRAVAASALWRCAVHGGDPNWGRVLSALGAEERDLDLSQVSIAIGEELVFAFGEPQDAREFAQRAMEAAEFGVKVIVGRGSGVAEVLTTDLSPDYVKLNAWGTT